MDLLEAIENRHTVREYKNQPIEGEVLAELETFISQINQVSGLHIQLVLNEPKAFSGAVVSHMAKAAQNYLGIIGKDDESLSEKGGYYGEKIVLRAQQLGLNTHWIAMYNEKKVKQHLQISPGEKLLIVITIGYGANQGTAHDSKALAKLGTCLDGEMPDWFVSALEAAQKAPTGLNRQDFFFELSGKGVKAKAGSGSMAKINMGIAKYHFEIGAGKADWHWAY